MASQMELKFEQLNVFVGMAQMDCSKADVAGILELLKQQVDGARTVAVTE